MFQCCGCDSRCCNYLFSNVAYVATLFSIFFMLQTLILDVADVESRCCRHVLSGVANIFFNVADVAFRCCKHVVLGCCVEEKRKRLMMLDVARNTGRNMAAI
jgi:hypothetical protein